MNVQRGINSRLMVPAVLLAAGLAACGAGGDADPPAAAATASTADAVQSTAEVHADDNPVGTPISEVPPAVEVISQQVSYGATAERSFSGYFVLPADVTEPVPGVIMIHEWWGLNDNIRAMARRLAGEGYAVLAVDLYDGATAATAAEAQQLMSALVGERDLAIENLRQAHNYLDRFALAPSVGTVGWCLGGAWSLEAAVAMGEEIEAAVMFYGQTINDPARLASLEAPLLGLFAADDESIPVRNVQAFRSALAGLGKESEVLIYPDVGHAFANPSGNAYNHAAATEAWDKTLEFLREELY